MHYTRLEQSSAAFNKMMEKFGIVTVMNAYVFSTDELLRKADEGNTITAGLLTNGFDKYTADQICKILAEEANKTTGHDAAYLCKLDTLKTSNITEEGPTKTVTGGQNSSPLLKFGKTARLEMQDALGNAEALEALGGMTVEYVQKLGGTKIALHAGDTFSGPRTILGESFFIDQATGAQVDVYILIYQFLPDSIFNLTQDAEGDATVFDMNGDLIATAIQLGTKTGSDGTTKEYQVRNVFYSICDKNHNHEQEAAA